MLKKLNPKTVPSEDAQRYDFAATKQSKKQADHMNFSLIFHNSAIGANDSQADVRR